MTSPTLYCCDVTDPFNHTETVSEAESHLTTTTESSSGGGGGAEESASEPRSPPELERQIDVQAPTTAATAQSDAAFSHKTITQWNVSGRDVTRRAPV